MHRLQKVSFRSLRLSARASCTEERIHLCFLENVDKDTPVLDYVISQGNLIIPVEVKAGRSGSLKSLQQFIFYKKAETAVRFDLNPPSVQNIKHVIRTRDGNRPVAFKLISLPLYMVEELSRILNDLRRPDTDHGGLGNAPL